MKFHFEKKNLNKIFQLYNKISRILLKKKMQRRIFATNFMRNKIKSFTRRNHAFGNLNINILNRVQSNRLSIFFPFNIVKALRIFYWVNVKDDCSILSKYLTLIKHFVRYKRFIHSRQKCFWNAIRGSKIKSF